MSKITTLFVLVVLFLGGCATVPLRTVEESNKAKQFNQPSKGNSGLYIYRVSLAGAALKKDIWVDGRYIGESASGVFFYEEVVGDKKHTVSTESEFSPNDLDIVTKKGQNYFIEQYIRPGLFVGGAGLKIVDTEEGMRAVSKLDLAKKGTRSK